MNTPNRWGLTGRQQDVVELIAQGLTNAEICAALMLGPDSVRTHVRLAMAKMRVSNRIQAAQLVMESATGSTIRQEINVLSRRLARLQEAVDRVETGRRAIA